MDITIINDLESIYDFKATIKANNSNEFALDLEGDNLSRHGKINFIQIFLPQIDKVYIFECSSLGKTEIQSALRPILENESNPKYMFDCRSDSDALYHQYGIELKGVVDVQLFEIGYRKSKGYGGNYYSGLFKTLTKYGSQVDLLSGHLTIKNKFSNQFKDKNFEIDLSDMDGLRYLAIDVIYLKKLFSLFESKIGYGNVHMKIMTETRNRENTWKKPVFINDRSNAISLI